MNKSIYITALATLSLTACHEVDFYNIANPANPGHPMTNPGQITINTPATLPDGTSVTPDNTTITLIAPNGTEYAAQPEVSIDVPAGSYQIVIVSGLPPTNTAVTIVGTTVVANTLPGGEIASMPTLFGGISTVIVVGNDSRTVTPVLAPLTRQVVVTCKVRGLTTNDFRQCEIRLTGVAASRMILPSRTSADGYFVRATSHTLNADGTLGVTFTLLGVDTALPQMMHISIERTNGTSVVLEQEVTKEFSDFNRFDTTPSPLSLGFAITLGVGDITGDIEPWEPGLDEDIEG